MNCARSLEKNKRPIDSLHFLHAILNQRSSPKITFTYKNRSRMFCKYIIAKSDISSGWHSHKKDDADALRGRIYRVPGFNVFTVPFGA